MPDREWEGQTAFVIGGGTSLRGFDASVLRGKNIIAVNESGLTLTPWADVLFFADRQRHRWNADRMLLHEGRFKVTRSAGAARAPEGVKLVQFRCNEPFSTRPWQVSGWCGGGSSLNLAAHFGASRIVLLGFDMAGLDFHDMHHNHGPESRYAEKFIPAIEVMAPGLKARGIEVLNATPGSRLTCFKRVELQDVL